MESKHPPISYYPAENVVMLPRPEPLEIETVGPSAPDVTNDRKHFPRGKKPKSNFKSQRPWILEPDNLLVTMTVVAVISGMVLGVILRITTNPKYRTIQIVSFPGELLMNMLKMLIIPLISSSLITGLASLDSKSSGKIGMWAMIYYTSTTAMAVVLGIILVLAIRPGKMTNLESLQDKLKEQEAMPPTLDAFMDLFRNLVPPNIVQACTHQIQSYMKNVTLDLKINGTKVGQYHEERIEQKFVEYTNVLGIVTFSIAFGLVLAQMGKQGKLMVDFFVILNEVIMRIVKVIMWYSPFGILSLIIGKMLTIEDLKGTAHSLGLYMFVVILGLVIHSCGTLALLFFVITRRNPAIFFKNMFQAWVTALGTASSAATLPVTFKCLEVKNHIDPRVTRFVLPVGATINMDGTALYEAVASIFIAQVNDKDLSISTVFIISITATLAAIGAASVPSAGLVTMILVLTSAGLPTRDISLILTVDWLLDRLRTSVNVLGDAFGAGIVDHLCRDDLRNNPLPPTGLEPEEDAELPPGEFQQPYTRK